MKKSSVQVVNKSQKNLKAFFAYCLKKGGGTPKDLEKHVTDFLATLDADSQQVLKAQLHKLIRQYKQNNKWRSQQC